MSEKIKPCPFCGSDEVNLMIDRPNNLFSNCYKVICFGCQATSALKETGGMAIEAWNRRKENDK